MFVLGKQEVARYYLVSQVQLEVDGLLYRFVSVGIVLKDFAHLILEME